MDSGAGVLVINLVSLFHILKFFDAKFKSCVCIYGATSKKTSHHVLLDI